MTDAQVVVLVGVLLILGMWLPACWVMHKMVGALKQMSGATLRAQERERRLQADAMERLVEKATIHTGAAMTVHNRERIDKHRIDAQVERTAIEEQDGTPSRDDDEAVDPANATY